MESRLGEIRNSNSGTPMKIIKYVDYQNIIM